MGSFQTKLDRLTNYHASRLAKHHNCIDMVGMDHDDYQASLKLKVLERFNALGINYESDSGSGVLAEKIAGDKATDYFRKKFLREQIFTNGGAWGISESTPEMLVTIEEQIINKDLLAKLKATLQATDWSILMAYVGTDTIREAWKVAGGDLSERNFSNCLRSILAKCKKILRLNTK